MLVENFKKSLAKEALEICGEEDRFRGTKIEIAPLQISKQAAQDTIKLDQAGHFHHREEIVSIYSEKPSEIIAHEEIFEVAEHQALATSKLCNTKEAKAKHMLRYSNLAFISGQAGIGKSTLSKLLVMQMLNPDVRLYEAEFVFYLRFRDLDYESDLDLLQLLTNSSSFVSDLTLEERINILKHLEACDNVLMVMDGLDEATINLRKQVRRCNVSSNTTAANFILNLLSGQLLPKSKKIITSRPRQLAQLEGKDFSSNLYLNLLGLSDKGQLQISHDICRNDPARQERITGRINSRPDLKSLCYVPIICIMVMMSFWNEDQIKDSNIDTLTAVLVTTLEVWFLKKLQGDFQTKQISILAHEGFLSNRFYFREFDLKQAKINFENTSAFLTNNIKFHLFQGRTITYFAHLMWQEFFVAIKLRLFTSQNDFKEILPQLTDAKFEVVTRFLFGLCNKRALEELLDCVDFEELNSESDRQECERMLKEFAISRLQRFWQADFVNENRRDLYFSKTFSTLMWIQEMGNDDMAKQAAACLRDEFDISHIGFLPSDIPSIIYILRARETKLTLVVNKPSFIGNCSHYFFKELHTTTSVNPMIQVSYLYFSLD